MVASEVEAGCDESGGGAKLGAAVESAGVAEAGAGAEDGSGVDAVDGVEVVALGSALVGAEGSGAVADASGVGAEGGASAVGVAAGAGASVEPVSGVVVGSVSAIFSFGMTCAMPSSACSSRGTSSGYFVFQAATNFPRGLVSMTEKSRIIAGSSIARINSIDWSVPIDE